MNRMLVLLGNEKEHASNKSPGVRSLHRRACRWKQDKTTWLSVENNSLTNVTRTGSDEDLKFAIWLQPLVLLVAPCGEIVLCQVERYFLSVAFRKVFTAETTEDLGRFTCGAWEFEVGLPDFVAVPFASVV